MKGSHAMCATCNRRHNFDPGPYRLLGTCPACRCKSVIGMIPFIFNAGSYYILKYSINYA